jgi:hypothetical protein
MKTRVGTMLLVLASALYALGDGLAAAGEGYDKAAPIVADRLGSALGWIGDHVGGLIVYAACCLALLLAAGIAIKEKAPALAGRCVNAASGAIGAIESFAHGVQSVASSAWAFRVEILAEGRA